MSSLGSLDQDDRFAMPADTIQMASRGLTAQMDLVVGNPTARHDRRDPVAECRQSLVTPRCSVRTVNPATVVANQRKVGNRENAGRNMRSAFHHMTHNGIGTPICSCRVIIDSIAYIGYTVNMATTRIEQIQKRIERIKMELVAIDEMRPGSQLLAGREKSN
jgi:hypothetical protein